MFSALRVAFGPATLFLAAGLALGTPLSPSNADAAGDAAPPVLLAQTAPDPAIAEKEAFEAAKELGTVDAWNAFLKTYATGFRADLARAYIAKLGQDAAPATAIAPPPSQVVAPPVQATTPPPVEPRLGLIDLGPGVAPWQNGMLDLDDGNRPAYVAQVAGNGMELIAYCRPPETKKGAYSLALRLHENPRGVYPEFDMRLQQGIDGSPAAGPDFRQIALRFDDGSVFGVTGRVFGMTGELEITENGKPLAPTGKIIESMMGGRTMTVLADPFSGTFQLSNSRPAICSVLAACGVKISACKGIAAPKISSKQITPLKQTKTFVPAQQGGGAALVIQQTATGPCPDPKAQVRNSAGQCVCSALYTSVGGQCVKACVGTTRDQNGNCQCPAGQPNPYGYCIDGTDQASIQKTVKAGEATTCPDGRLRDVSGNCLGWCSGERIWNGQKCISAKEAKNYYCRDLGIPEAGAQNGACKAAPGSVAAKFIPGQGTGQPQGGASPIFQLFQGPQGGQGAGTGATLTIQGATGPCPDPNSQVRNSAGACVCKQAFVPGPNSTCMVACVGGIRDAGGKCQCPTGSSLQDGIVCVKQGEALKFDKCPDGRPKDASGACLSTCPEGGYWNGQKCISKSEAKNYSCGDLSLSDEQAKVVGCKPATQGLTVKLAPQGGAGQQGGGGGLEVPLFQLFGIQGGTTQQKIACTGGQVAQKDGKCACPNGQTFNGKTCVVDKVVRTQDPTGAGGVTVQKVVCTGGQLPQKDGSCACPDGKAMVNGKCPGTSGGTFTQTKTTITCTGGQYPSNGQCVCPAGKQFNGSQCVAQGGGGGQPTFLPGGGPLNLPGILSDRRAKTDVTEVAKLPNGIRLYAFRYLTDDAMHVGVMAQDLLADVRTRAAVYAVDGLYRVDYAALGLRMATFAEWRERGVEAVLTRQ